MNDKKCRKCLEVKPLSSFYFRTDSNKYRTECKQCVVDRCRLRTTGWTPEQYKSAFERQGGRCKICRTHQEDLTQSLVADHCHASESTRSLLCHLCNAGLGMFKDNTERLRNAALYLEYHNHDN